MAFTFKHGDRPLEGYTIQRGVGRGGFGEVYYAVSDGGREVALKYLRDNPQVELRGVGHCMNLKSPHLVSIFDVKKNAEGDYFIVMEYIPGPSLRDILIAEPKGLGVQKAAFFVREIAKGLAYLHDRGVVHRDLKPGNIFYDDGYVKIGDYGLSKFISISRHSAQTASVGTVHYMAPEVGSGDYSRGIDIYALGVMLYEMLLGRLPFEGSSMGEVLMKHLTERPEVDDLPDPFGKVIHKALEKDPKDRYQSVDEMLEDIFEVSSVKDSLAGFSPEQSLAGAVANRVADLARTPAPSPNPPPPVASPLVGDERLAAAPPRRVNPAAREVSDPAQYADRVHPDLRPLADRLSKRANRMAVRFDKALRRVQKRAGVRPRTPGATGGLSASAVAPRAGKVSVPHYTPTNIPEPAPSRSRLGSPTAIPPRARRQRMFLSGMMAIGLPIGFGVAVASAHGREEWGLAAGMLTLAVVGGILLSRRMLRWFDAQAQPAWVRRLVTATCCTPLVLLGAGPLLDGSRSDEEGLGLALGLLAVTLFGRWGRSLEKGADGGLYLGDAFNKALGALICTAALTGIVGGNPGETIFVAAGAAAAACIILQTVGWWTIGARTVSAGVAGAGNKAGTVVAHDPATDQAMRRDAALTDPQEPPHQPWARVDAAAPPDVASFDPQGVQARTLPDQPTPPPPFGVSPYQTAPGAMQASAVPDAALRSGFGRGFWSLMAFIALLGAIFSFTVPFVTQGGHGPPVALPIMACIASVCFALFALSKTTSRRREGFWRETARPFILMLLAIGIGSFIVMLTPAGKTVQKNHSVAIQSIYGNQVVFGRYGGRISHRSQAPYIGGIVAFSVAFATTALAVRRRRRRAPKPFLVANGSSWSGQSPPPSPPDVPSPPNQSEPPGDDRA